MNRRWGSHGRWRIALLALTCGVLAWGIYLSLHRKQWRLVPLGGGPPVLSVAETGATKSIEAWDPVTNRRWTVVPEFAAFSEYARSDSVAVVRDGKAVAWVEKGVLHAVEVEPPHRRDTWKMPNDLGEQAEFLGFSTKERFGVFRIVGRNLGPVVTFDYRAIVVDLHAGQIVDTQALKGSPRESWRQGEFETFQNGLPAPGDPEPRIGRWTVDEAGQFKLSTDLSLNEIAITNAIVIARKPHGAIRWIDPNETVHRDESSTYLPIAAISPSGGQFLAYDLNRRDHAYLGNSETRDLRRFNFPRGETYQVGMSHLADHVVLIDHAGDFHYMNARAGRTVTNRGGTWQTWRFAAVALVAFAMLVGWCLLALSEKSPSWAMVDVALVTILLGWLHGWLGEFLWPNEWLAGPGVRSLLGTMFGVAVAGLLPGMIAVAWYWVYGPGWVLWRWLIGLVWLVAVTTSIQPIVWHREIREIVGPPSTAWLGVYQASVILAAIVAGFGAVPRLRGWAIETSSSHTQTAPKFALSQLFAVIACVSSVFAMARLASVEMLVACIPFGIEALSFGLCWPAALFCRNRWYAVAFLVLGLSGASFVAWFLAQGLMFAPATSQQVMMYHAPFWLLIALVLGLPCFLLQRRGYRWTRGEVVVSLPEPAT